APIDAVEVARAHRDTIGGIKAGGGKQASGDPGTAPPDTARLVAGEVGMPLMVHIDHPPPMLDEVLIRMRKGDILTHCFRPFPNCPSTAEGGVRASVLDARRRGI